MDDFEPESDLMNIEIMVVIPWANFERKLYVNPENTAREEKENILRLIDNTKSNDYVLVLIGPQGRQTVLVDDETLDTYTDELANSTDYYLEVRRRGDAASTAPRPINQQLMNINIK
ncbi:hypothetical protein Btru_071907 [Bulinus truncatus]|nr:hypothetical protein Btru_071907 [Bulinus truncatus]